MLGRELREVLGQSKPAPAIEMISASVENATMLASDEEEVIALTPLTAQSLTGARVAFLAGSPASSRRALKLNPADGPVLIDLTAALEDQPHARLRAPSAEVTRSLPQPGVIHVIAHPAAIASAMLLVSLSKTAPIRSVVIHIFEPASERGKKGLDELRQQTVGVLTFQKLKTDVFDTQLSFAMLARYGEEALEPLEGVEQRIEKHLASLLASYPGIPMPSLRLIQAPVFHGHSFSAWVEFEEAPGLNEITSALETAGVDVRSGDPPSNANIAGQSGLSIGAIAPDSNHPRAYWVWMVADNLKLSAENALSVARGFLR
ncbi:MAG: hypothetical protein EXQ47_07760 [Bryobacterales bacterium]|nr:hypothetical protein [Bryobacterales bacterium]